MTKIFPAGPIPTIAHDGDAGIDLRYYGKRDIVVEPGTLYKIHTGLHVEIPVGKCGIIFERSGLGMSGADIHGRIIDSGYRGEIIVLLSIDCAESIDSETEECKRWYPDPANPLIIKPGDKVAQMVIVDCFPSWQEVKSKDDLSVSERGSKGLGSSGR